MAAEISYASLKISRQMRECVSKFCLNVYLKPWMLKPMVWLILKESCTTEAVTWIRYVVKHNLITEVYLMTM